MSKRSYYLVVLTDPHDDDKYHLFRTRVPAIICAEGCKTGLTMEYPARFRSGWREETDAFGGLPDDLVLRFEPVGNFDGFSVKVLRLRAED